MSAIEIVLGDFEPGVVRIRHSTAGRRILRLASLDGIVEDIALETEVTGCAEHDEGEVAAYLARWLRRAGQELDEVVAQSFRHERLFVVVLRDGRKFVARSTADVVAELKAMAGRASRSRAAAPRRERPAAAAAPSPGFFARLRLGKA